MKEALFDETRHISLHKIKNGCMNLQRIADKANRKALFTSQFEERSARAVMEKLHDTG